MFKDLDFYEVLKAKERGGLDPNLSRDENYQALRAAARIWNRRTGSEADLMKQLINEAMGIFSNESQYNAFREWRTENRLGLFVDGAVDTNSELIADKRDEALDRGRKEGITGAEIQTFLKKRGINVKPNPTGTCRNTTNTKWWNKQIAMWIPIVAALSIALILTSAAIVVNRPSSSVGLDKAAILLTQVEKLLIEHTSSSLEKAKGLCGQVQRLYPPPEPAYIEQSRKKLAEIKVIYTDWGDKSMETQDYNQAVGWYEKALSIDPNDSSLRGKKADAEFMSQN